MIKYIGSKRVLIPLILDTIRCFSFARSVIDLFSGTSRVGHALKKQGYQVFANDHNAYAHTLARCYVAADHEQVASTAEKLIRELNRLPGRAGFFTETYCQKARFFQPKNGERIDVIRERISELDLDPELEAVLLVSLMEAADRVDSTTGVQMAYLKNWAARSYNDLELRLPEVLPQSKHGKSQAYGWDAEEAVQHLQADIAYLDPPYNQHKYLGNYHVWESLVLWDKPTVYGVAQKRVDCKSRQSLFNSRKQCLDALRRVLAKITAKVVVLSFNNEGHITRADIEALLATRGEVATIETDYKRYVGAQIGIYNPAGQKVGKVSHLRNTEYLYLAGELRLASQSINFQRTNLKVTV